jgi:hypothetical protein
LSFSLADKACAFCTDPDRGELFRLPEVAALLAGEWRDPFALRWHGTAG